MNVQSNPFLFESAALSHLPGFGAVRSTQLAGYLSVGDSAGGWLYFCFSEAGDHPEQAPLLVWINGAPEWSALDALLDEHGPYLLDPSGRVYSNPFGWHHHVNLLIIEQPLGHGLSFTTHPRYLPESHDEASLQLYHALQEFLLRWPRYRERDCYLFGNAAATHTIARLAHRVLDGNSGGQPQISLKGLGLGNAQLAPDIQLPSHIDYAYQHRLINLDERNHAQAGLDEFNRAHASPIALQQQSAGRIAVGIERYIQQCCGRDLHDIRHPPQKPSKALSEYLKKPSVQQALHIDPRSNNELQPHSSLMTEAIWQESSSHLLPTLLDQLKVLFFHGECCMTGNYLGLDAWFNTQSWSQADAFRRQKRQAWRPYGLAAGLIRSHGNLSQIIIQNAGLRVARDQPAAAQAMLRDFLAGDAPQ
ncbi:S10 family serine carboxypeptidase-like protein [Chromobacterium violaceum]|uniref:S10 family serine carboxypeptidase-like protein n=1 Tax=Chromobacterium violaceum TaxID=536 RepID=UPI0009D95499|nr:hypothetical protein [Chromobacterium violaceum]ATP29368.1 hypothetical protein CRN81_13700 [Chromobacterium violaceum]ATP33274.1 hypothetical protein CR207_13710 [Chromobacterium violaceum]MCD0492742.1 S10 family peptidase [Chromobacterium violaceum]OQS48040.1 hypothetical protein B0T48_10830 [Chromobacterium violaceum]OQS50835.1 hypothetical protein B0T49_10710 [Chromobacterium violaceum]